MSRRNHLPRARIRRLAFAIALPAMLACGSEPGDGQQPADGVVCQRAGNSDLPAPLSEASGVAASTTHPGVFWLHNDSGGDPILYAVDVRGRLLGTVRVTGADNNDWEDIALGPCPTGTCVYIADTGDNNAKRNDVAIFRVPEPDPTDGETAPAERFELRYPGGPRDAEALFVLPDGGLFIVSKGERQPVELFRSPTPFRADATATLRSVRALSTGPVQHADRVTGADAAPDGQWIAVRSYSSLMLYRADKLLGTGDPRALRVDLTPVGEMQGEGVALRADGTVVLASEGTGKKIPGTLSSLQCSLPQ